MTLTQITSFIHGLNPEDVYFDGTGFLCFDWYFENEDGIFTCLQDEYLIVIQDKDDKLERFRLEFKESEFNKLKEIIESYEK